MSVDHRRGTGHGRRVQLLHESLALRTVRMCEFVDVAIGSKFVWDGRIYRKASDRAAYLLSDESTSSAEQTFFPKTVVILDE